MLDRNIVEQKVRDKILDKTFSAIVESCFIYALPFHDEDKKPYVKELMKYTDTVLESLVVDGSKVEAKFDILVNAIESTTDENKSNLLMKIARICMEAADAVATRVVKSDDIDNKTLDEILESVGLDKDEREDFNKNVSELNINKISEVVKDKVVDVIKSEKKEEEEAAALEEKLKEAITPEDEKDTKNGGDKDDDDELDDSLDTSEMDEEGSDDVTDAPDTDDLSDDTTSDDDSSMGDEGTDEDESEGEGDEDDKKSKGKNSDDDINININIDQGKKKKATESMTYGDIALESFYQYRLKGTQPRRPVSFLSKLTDFATESVLTVYDEGEIPMNALYKATFESNMPFFDKEISFDDVLEGASLTRVAESVSTQDIGSKPLIVSIIIYTVLETLKTLNIYSPTKSQVADVVNSVSTLKDNSANALSIAREEVEKKLKRLNGELESAMKYHDVSAVEFEMDSLKADIEMLGVTESLGLSGEVEKLEYAITQKKRNVLDDSSPIISAEIRKVAMEAEMGINKLQRLFGKNPAVAMMEVRLDSTVENYTPTVTLRNHNGDIVNSTFININYSNLRDDGLMKAFSMGIEAAAKTPCGKTLKVVDESKQRYTTTEYTI